jgi:uncharacterized membrane protein
MFTSIRNLNRFLLDQAFYPITLSSLLGLAFFAGRVILTHNTVIYRNLVWNLFLAWIPYLFSMLAVALHASSLRKWWRLLLPAAVWLAFFPNAPYILTDFLHLSYRYPIPLWYDIGLLASFAWSGLFLAVVSLKSMQELVRAYLGAFVSWVFTLLALSLGGLGLYLGRFSGWNSWDLLFRPRSILADLAARFSEPLSNVGFFTFTFMFTALLLVFYLTFISVQRIGRSVRPELPKGERFGEYN